ncbi:MAG: dephospho-CoA kinase [Roseiflexaceae bacterium]
MYLIGLTGNIACGKSTVVAQLRELGAHVVDADAITHQLQQPGQAVYQAIIAAFGPTILSEAGGPINRRALAAIVFSDPAELKRLEQIVHPAVHDAIESWLEQARTAGARVAVIDAIKLIEAGWPESCDAIWVVACQPAQQLERLMRTRGMSEAEAQRRIEAQPPQADKIAHADVVIDNSGTLAATHAQVLAAWQQLPS